MSLRQWLRQASGPLHARVDEAFGAFALDSREGYRRFLRAHGRALGTLEPALEAAGVDRLLADWPQRRRRMALRDDLAQLGEPMPAPLAAPAIGGEAWCWGAVYVLEGSRLGARVLTARVRPAEPLGYLGHGAGQPLWPGFLQALESGAQALDPAQLQAGAEAAFALFLQAAEAERAA
ncbi:biliverdin-producing heme oxygenase [Stutzerimonas azotifigens]|uniref:biliverdin-producing heme oxygenase n=1 Tax=Stutzerimonas azotifigens TaxID=291995 RepID=UPI0003FED40C|nr:biliverdin-producing heme oxygenase [Stutzerimonas azotifigens]